MQFIVKKKNLINGRFNTVGVHSTAYEPIKAACNCKAGYKQLSAVVQHIQRNMVNNSSEINCTIQRHRSVTIVCFVVHTRYNEVTCSGKDIKYSKGK